MEHPQDKPHKQKIKKGSESQTCRQQRERRNSDKESSFCAVIGRRPSKKLNESLMNMEASKIISEAAVIFINTLGNN